MEPRALRHALHHYVLRAWAKIILADFNLVVSTETAKPPNLISCQIYGIKVCWHLCKCMALPCTVCMGLMSLTSLTQAFYWRFYLAAFGELEAARAKP